MSRKLLICCFLFFAAASLTGCPNAFQESAKKDTSEAVYFAAQRDLDLGDYDSAITKLNSLNATFKTKRDVVATIASAYAGRCGLNFLTLVETMSNNTGSRLLPILLTQFSGSTASNIADCAAAEVWLRTLAPTNNFASLTTDENIMLAILSLAKVGAAIATYADLNADGSVDGGFNACNTANLPDATAREIGTGITLSIAAFAASGSAIAGAALGSVTDQCSSLPPGYDFCSIYTPADFTADQMKAVNGLIGSQDLIGLGSCADTLANCVCP